MMLFCSSAQDASSPESSDSGIQTDHNSTSHIDSLLPYSMTSSCHHSNNVSNNNADGENDDDNDTNNNNSSSSRQRFSHVTAHVKGCHAEGHGKVQGRNEGQALNGCDTRSATTPSDVAALTVDF